MIHSERYLSLVVVAGLLSVMRAPAFGGSLEIPPTLLPDPILYDQTDNCEGVFFISQDYTDAGGVNDNLDSLGADDFAVPATEVWEVTGVYAFGIYGGIVPGGPADSVNVFFFADANGSPGELITQRTGVVPVGGLANASFSTVLDPPVTLGNGVYWVGVQANQTLSTGEWAWGESSLQSGNPAVFENPGDGFSSGCTSFTPANQCVAIFPDLCFAITGNTTRPLAPAPALSSAATVMSISLLIAVGLISLQRRRWIGFTEDSGIVSPKV